MPNEQKVSKQKQTNAMNNQQILTFQYTLYKTFGITHPHPLTPLVSSNFTTHQYTSFAFSVAPLISCSLASSNHASLISHPPPNFVNVCSSPDALSLAVEFFSSARSSRERPTIARGWSGAYESAISKNLCASVDCFCAIDRNPRC